VKKFVVYYVFFLSTPLIENSLLCSILNIIGFPIFVVIIVLISVLSTSVRLTVYYSVIEMDQSLELCGSQSRMKVPGCGDESVIPCRGHQ